MNARQVDKALRQPSAAQPLADGRAPAREEQMTDSSAANKGAATKGSSLFKVALTAGAGATIEWYDFFVYGTAAALVFPKIFFAADLPPLVAQLAAFSTFAVGFIARPFGGIVFGHFGDLFGRKKALLVALLTMGLATTAIGFLPTYASVGVFSPLLLLALRFVQGIAVGGQWGGAALMAIESAPPGRGGFYGSFVQMGVPLGVVLSNIVFFFVVAAFPQNAFETWAWRVPFILSIALVFVGLYIQTRLEESVAFEQAARTQDFTRKEKRKSPVLQVLTRHPRKIVLAGGAFIASNTCFYAAITYAVSYGDSVLHLSRSAMLASVVAASVVMVPGLLFFGALSDRWGRSTLFMAGAALTGLWSFAFFPLLETLSYLAVLVALIVELLCLSVMYGPQAALFAELFPVEVRYSGASLGYQLGAVIGGGFAPIIATALFAKYASTLPISIFLFGVCFISLTCTYFLTRDAKSSSARRGS
ncbi:MFS transporter [Nitrospirillum viridazoti]|uniref:MFS transporter n=1 Tax=Nitrospirillum viridazoti TaxID=3144925 RepID=UPI0011ACD5CF|nr:MFS transporter [Nitrospirillum amazonense]TWB44548.1 MFS transporter [Nitrospirillum amazonense]